MGEPSAPGGVMTHASVERLMRPVMIESRGIIRFDTRDKTIFAEGSADNHTYSHV